MTALRQLQQHFLASVREGQPHGALRFSATADFPAAQRLAVYIDAYLLRLAEALEENYPALHTLLGDDEFLELTKAYLGAQPSRHFSIRYFGHDLAGFLSTQSPYRHQPVLAEMACFEWALRDVFDAPDATAVTAEQLAQLDPEAWGQLSLRGHPAVRRLDLNWNVPALWSAIDANTAPLAPNLQSQAVAWVLWRRDLRTFFQSLVREEADSFDLLCGGANFGELCEALAARIGEEQAPLQAATYLADWLGRGWLSR